MTEQQIQIGLEPIIFYLNNINISFSEEEFLFLMQSGNQARRYLATPKHAKRILLLLQKQIEMYEKQFEVLDTVLPEAKPEDKTPMGFDVQTQNQDSPSANPGDK